jgi:hypothetical protein
VVVCRSFCVLTDNNMHVNYSLSKVGVYKMAVSMVSVVRCTGKIWNGEREIFALQSLSCFYDLVGVHTTLLYSVC